MNSLVECDDSVTAETLKAISPAVIRCYGKTLVKYDKAMDALLATSTMKPVDELTLLYTVKWSSIYNELQGNKTVTVDKNGVPTNVDRLESKSVVAAKV